MARGWGRVLAFGLGLVLLEVALQGAALLVGGGSRAGHGAGQGVSLLALGDSHTYGLNVAPEHTWPAQLEARLRVAEPTARVVNRGQVGKHTGHLLAGLPGDLERYRPAVVLVLAGVNNAWSRGAMASEDGGEPWYMHLRTAKLTLILAQRFGLRPAPGETGGAEPGGASAPRPVTDPAALANPPAPGQVQRTELGDGRALVRTLDRDGQLVEFEIGGGVLEEGEESLAATWIERDLGRIAERARAGGAEVVFLTYAIEDGLVLPTVNAAIRRAAAANGALLVDQAALAKPWIAEFGKERLFFHDAHPRREGYELLSAAIHSALVSAGWVEGEPGADAAAALRERGAPTLRLVPLPGPGAAATELDLGFEPGLEFSVLLARSTGPGFALGKARIPLLRDELFEAALDFPELKGAFGPDGRARVELSPAARAALAGGPVWAVLLVRTPDWSIVAQSEPLELGTGG